MFIPKVARKVIEAALDQPNPTAELRRALEAAWPEYQRHVERCGDLTAAPGPAERRGA